MEMYKKASKVKLRVLTSRGSLSPEQLWDLTVEELDSIAVRLEEEKKTSNSKSFLKNTENVEDTLVKLRFDVVLDILKTKVQISETALKSQETKAHNQKILALIEKKKEGEMAEMSIEDLEALLK